MGTFPRHSGLFVFSAAAPTAVFLVAFMGSPQSARALACSGLIVAEILTSVLAVQRSLAEGRGMMPPDLVIHFATLLLFGPHVAVLVVAAGAVAYLRADSQRSWPIERTV